MRDFNNGMNELLSHKFPHSLIHINEIFKELPHLKLALNNKNIRLLYESAADLATSPTSFIINNDTLHFFIHIPISHAPQLTAYKFIPTPIISIIDKSPILHTISTENKIFATNRDGTTYTELKDLHNCIELPNTRFSLPGHSCAKALTKSLVPALVVFHKHK